MGPSSDSEEKAMPEATWYSQGAFSYIREGDELGGESMMPVTEQPQVGRFSWISDPQGAAIAFIQRAPERRQ
jgi:predicted enzyme related to lactoylglutathione lyase